MEDKEEQKEIKIQQRDEECDTSTISEKPDASDSSTREKATHSIRPAFICTSVLTVIFPILWFVVTAMVSGTGDGYDSLWYVRLLGGDSVGDTSNGRGIIILLSFGWTFGLFLVFSIQGNNILRAIYGNVDPRADKRLSLCASKKKKMEPQGVDERKLGILIGCLFCFSNLCFILCFSFAWPALEKNFTWKSILSEKLTIPLANLLWAVWSLTFTFMFSVVPNKRTQSSTATTDAFIKLYSI